MSETQSSEPASSVSIRNALECWTPFALPPLRLEVPLTWFPRLVTWAEKSVRVRFETLIETPFELSWTWDERQAGQQFTDITKRLDAAWKKEQDAAEAQAKSANAEFAWIGESRSTDAERAGLPEAAKGFTRRYRWGGRESILGAVYFETSNRRALVGFSVSPEKHSSSKLTRDSQALITRMLGSLKLAAENEPNVVAWNGVRANFPSGMTLDTLKQGGGQLFLDWKSNERRFSLIRLGCGEQHLAMALETARKARRKEKKAEVNLATLDDAWPLVCESLALRLFDRSEGPGLLYQIAGSGPAAQEAKAPADAQDDEKPALRLGHACSVYSEKRRFYVAWGDTMLRKFGRKWSGEGLAALWRCEATGSLWGLSARTEPEKTRAELETLLNEIHCHGEDAGSRIDWVPALRALKFEKKKSTKKDEQDKKAEPAPDPAEQRFTQLNFKIKRQNGVRMEVSSKDKTGRLLYELAAPTGLLAKLSGADRPGQPYFRTLELDPIGCRVWELLENGPTVGELIAKLSSELHVHPVEFYDLVLGFLRLMGDKGLVTAGELTDTGKS